MAGGSDVYRQLSPGESKGRSRHMTTTTSANESGVGIDGVCVDSSPAEGDDGAPRHSSRFAAVSRSLTRSESMQGVADNNLIVARLMRLENGRMTVCLASVSFYVYGSKWSGRGRTHAPLSVVPEDCICLTEREELFPGLGLFVHIRVELLAQLHSPPPKKKKM